MKVRMRLTMIAACAALAACTTGDISVPTDPVLQQVTPSASVAPMQMTAPATASSSSSAEFEATIENALGGPGVVEPGRPPVNPDGTPLDDDTLNLTLYTIEQQKIDARLAQQQLDAARSQLVVVQPTAVPRAAAGVNIALFAQQTTNAVGERVHVRSVLSSVRSGCGRYRSADDAQRAFLAAGGPAQDPQRLDSDGDGFACDWDPTPFRQLRG